MVAISKYPNIEVAYLFPRYLSIQLVYNYRIITECRKSVQITSTKPSLVAISLLETTFDGAQYRDVFMISLSHR